MKYLVCSDIHLNINRRFEDTLDALEQIYKLIKKHKVEKVLILGDVYTSRRPHSKEKAAFQRWIRKLTYMGIDVIIVKGNHDEYPDGTHSYSEFTELKIPNVQVLDNPGFEGDFFLGHLLLQEAKLGPIDYQNPNCMNVADLIQKYPSPLRSGAPCKAYLLGDVHKAQVIQKDPLVIYAGSINRVDFGERNDEKSVLLIDDIDEYPKFKCKRITLKSRPMIQYDIECKVGEDNGWALIRDKDEMKGAIIKIIYHGTTEALKGINEKNIRAYFTEDCQCKELIIQYKVEKESIARDERVNENITPQQALEMYVEKLDLQPEEKAALIKLSQEVMENATA